MDLKNEHIEILTAAYSPLELDASGIVELDLGCGKGTFALELARLSPDRLILAADVMLGRLRKLRNRKVRFQAGNLRILRTESRILVSRFLPDCSIDRIHVLCPDPWPKARHSHHRLICSEFVSHIHRILKKNGVFHFSTDDRAYFAAASANLADSGLFTRDDSGFADVAEIQTDFERIWKAEGRKVEHGAWRRKG